MSAPRREAAAPERCPACDGTGEVAADPIAAMVEGRDKFPCLACSPECPDCQKRGYSPECSTCDGSGRIQTSGGEVGAPTGTEVADSPPVAPSPAPESCPECGCHPGVTEETDNESAAFLERTAGKLCPNCGAAVAPSPVVDRDGLDEAVEAVARRYDPYAFERGESYAHFRVKARGKVRPLIEVAAPVIVRAERGRIREGIEKLRGEPSKFSDQYVPVDAVLALLDEEARNGD